MLASIKEWLEKRRTNKALAKSISAFKNREIHETLNPSSLAEISDEEIEQAIFDCAIGSMNEDLSKELEILPTFNDGMRFLYATWIVDAEVNNGGFNQYFWNSNGSTVDIAIDGFRYFGATDLADITDRAVQVWKAEEHIHAPLKEIGSLEAFSESYKETQLNSLDAQYFNSPTNLSALRISKIRSNPDQFSTKTKEFPPAT